MAVVSNRQVRTMLEKIEVDAQPTIFTPEEASDYVKHLENELSFYEQECDALVEENKVLKKAYELVCDSEERLEKENTVLTECLKIKDEIIEFNSKELQKTLGTLKEKVEEVVVDSHTNKRFGLLEIEDEMKPKKSSIMFGDRELS